MFVIRMADLNIELDNRHDYVEHLCRDYIVDTRTDKIDFRVRVNDTSVKAYIAACGRPLTLPQAEAQLLYRRICEILPLYKRVLLHASLIEADGRGYLFSAPRGTGKTTHTNLWTTHFPGRATVINGDKPVIRRADDGYFWAYGTPWCGKEGLQENRCAPLTAVCFLEQHGENCIHPASVADTAARLLEATILPPDANAQDCMASLIGEIVRTIPAFTLSCRPDVEAAEVAYKFLSQI